MNLNLPIIEQGSGCKNLLIAGMGGGFDVFCGLPIYFELQKLGINIHLANYSFSEITTFTGSKRLTSSLVGVDAEFNDRVIYFPELYLTKWFKEKRNEKITIWCFHKKGTRPLLDNYLTLVDHLNIDGILLIDGGVDSLIRGDEEMVATLIEDAISLHVVNELKDIPVRVIACIGFGAERHLNYGQILENIAGITRAGGFLGSCSLTPQMPAFKSYEDSVLYVQNQPYQDPSVINSSIISAVRGEFGNYHLTKKTDGSILQITPLMGMYWFFDLVIVAKRNLYLPHIANTETFIGTLHKYLEVKNDFKESFTY